MARTFTGASCIELTAHTTVPTVITVCCWARDVSGSSFPRVVDWAGDVNCNFDGAAGTMRFERQFFGALAAVNGPALGAGWNTGWHHYAWRNDGANSGSGGLALSYDLTSATVAIGNSAPQNWTGVRHIGNRGSDHARPLGGTLAWLSIHDVWLTDDELAQHYRTGDVPRGRIAWLPLWGTTEADYSGNALALTVTGTTATVDMPPAVVPSTWRRFTAGGFAPSAPAGGGSGSTYNVALALGAGVALDVQGQRASALDVAHDAHGALVVPGRRASTLDVAVAASSVLDVPGQRATAGVLALDASGALRASVVTGTVHVVALALAAAAQLASTGQRATTGAQQHGALAQVTGAGRVEWRGALALDARGALVVPGRRATTSLLVLDASGALALDGARHIAVSVAQRASGLLVVSVAPVVPLVVRRIALAARDDATIALAARDETTLALDARDDSTIAVNGAIDMAIETAIRWHQGDDVELVLTVDGSGALSGSYAAYVLSYDYARTLYTLTGDACQVTDADARIVTATLSSAQTSALAPGLYRWRVRRVDSGQQALIAYGVADAHR